MQQANSNGGGVQDVWGASRADAPLSPGGFGAVQIPAKRRSNVLGVIGFVLATIGLVACCLPYVNLVSLVGLLLSFIALFRPPRGFAIAGTLIGIVGSVLAVLVSLLALAVGAASSGVGGLQQLFSGGVIATQLEDYRNRTGTYPPDLTNVPVPLELRSDRWGTPLMYTPSKDGQSYTLRSNGPDRLPDTMDDIDLSGIFGGRNSHEFRWPGGPPQLPPRETPQLPRSQGPV